MKNSLKTVFLENHDKKFGAPGSPKLDKDEKQDILFDDSETCKCNTKPCNCVVEEKLSSTGGASSEGMALEEKELCEMAPKKKTPGPGPEFEHDIHDEDLESSMDFDDSEDLDSEEDEESEDYLDDFEGEIELEDEEDEEESEDEKYLRRHGYGRKDPRDSEEKSWRDVDLGGFVDPDDMPW